MADDGLAPPHPLARGCVRALSAPEPLLRDAQLGRAGIADLVSNTNPIAGGPLAHYPRAIPIELQARFAAFLATDGGEADIRAENVMFTEGSSAAIDLLVRTFCEPGRDRVCVCTPTFPLYERAASAAGVDVVPVALGGAQFERLDVDGLVAAAPKLTFVCSPNNPVGTSPVAADLEAVLRSLPGFVIVDEAYVEFAGRPSAVALTTRFPRLVVLRTFSKAWGLAGVRAGAAIGERGVLDTLRLVQPPYAFGRPAQQMSPSGSPRPR
jgi:histidinol-phosphate aminotransferase